MAAVVSIRCVVFNVPVQAFISLFPRFMSSNIQSAFPDRLTNDQIEGQL
jgi:hypothetical protein